jgi:hypothetical protein
MIEYWPFLVIFSFAVLLYLGTVLWTEVWFPTVDKKRERILEISDLLNQALAAQIRIIMQSYYSTQPGLFDKPEEEEKKHRKGMTEFVGR